MTSYAHNNMARLRMADLAERSHISVAQGPSLQRPRIVNTRKKTHGDFLDIYGSELCSKEGNFFRQIVLLYVAPKR